MKFSAMVGQVLDLLQRQGRVSYRMLKREFDLEDDIFADLKEELLYSHAQQIQEEGPGIVWIGNAEEDKGIKEDTENQDPSRWTPPHLAERIRATTVTDGERKMITALFADLKGSTALIEGLDPEEARAIIDPALQL